MLPCPQHTTLVLPAPLSAAAPPADLKQVALSPNETKPRQKWESSTTVQYLSTPGCKHAGPLQHCQLEEKSDLSFRACTGKCSSCWAQYTPERGDSSSIAFFAASKPYLHFWTSRSLMLCSTGKGRNTLKQDRSASSTSLFLMTRYGGKAAPLRKSCSLQPKQGPCVLGTCISLLCI